MGTLSYTATVSLDGYVADANGDFQWSAPDEEVFRFHVDRLATTSTEILGRRTYELMQYWETDPEDGSWTPDEYEFARLWRTLNRVVASSTLSSEDVGPGPARLVKDLRLADVRQILDDARGEVEIFGPTTAGEPIRAGMVKDFRFFIVPKMVGGGIRALPQDARLHLSLVAKRTFKNGTVFLHYSS